MNAKFKKLLSLVFVFVFLALLSVENLEARRKRSNRRIIRKHRVQKRRVKRRRIRRRRFRNQHARQMFRRTRRMIRMAVRSYRKGRKAKGKLRRAVRRQRAARRIFMRRFKKIPFFGKRASRSRIRYAMALTLSARRLARQVIMANRGRLSAADRRDQKPSSDYVKDINEEALRKATRGATGKVKETTDEDLKKDDGGLGDDKELEKVTEDPDDEEGE